MEKIEAFLSKNFGDGSGHGYGSGYGYGDGDGYGDGSGDGSGDGYGDGSGDGYGDGDGYGYGSGYGDGYGYGNGSGSGYGSGHGSGHGYGSGYGDGYGYGDGSGYGYGDGITVFNGRKVCNIDGVTTIITAVHGNTAKGYILQDDLQLVPCYVAKGDNRFAHGNTLAEAVEALREKLFEDMDTDEAIAEFTKVFKRGVRYPAKEFFVWHHRLTGSCKMGRDMFVKKGGYDLENDVFTVNEFVKMTENSYGGEIIKRLEEAYK